MAICSVALPLPISEPYDYAVPAGLSDRVQVGARVLVPVRSALVIGVVTGIEEEAAAGLKPVALAPDSAPLVPTSLLSLAKWMSGYYATPLGIVLRTMLPAGLWGRSQLVATIVDRRAAPGGVSHDVMHVLERAGGRASAARLRRILKRPVWDVLQRLSRVGAVTLETVPPRLGPSRRGERLLTITQHVPTIMEREALFGRAHAQRALYEAVDQLGGSATVRHIREVLGFADGVIRALVRRGIARIDRQETLRDPFADIAGTPAPDPNPPQQAAIDRLGNTAPGSISLVHGVTGSGKTLVYLQALREEVQRGSGAIVLVPEIALTPQTIARVRGLFGDQVAVLHSGLSEAERADAWLALVRGERRVAVGARSAVFAPVLSLATIVMDEEHDASYKHGERPRYHARDVAMRRGRYEAARVILGTATPSLEIWSRRERCTVITLPDRVGARPLPRVNLIDLKGANVVTQSGPIPWSVELDHGVESALASGDQILLLLNRRGYAHFLQCRECGLVWECDDCSISLTVHRVPERLRCHYCGHERYVPDACPTCGGAAHRTRGVGTQHLERWLSERFPDARLARMDADTTSRRWSHQRILDAVARREVDILFGTQMIAKGLDFPDVTLVGVVDADTGLHLPDFRAAERTFQLIAQVSGRAGRGPKGGQVLVQTRAPTHYALQAAAAHDYVRFANLELDARRDPPYPPHVALVNVGVSGEVEEEVAQVAVDVAEWLGGLVERHGDGVELIGPAPAPLSRIKRRWRWHLLMRSADRRLLGTLLRYAASRTSKIAGSRARVVFDRDPISLL